MDVLLFLFWMGKGLELIYMQMSGGHLLATGLDGGNTIMLSSPASLKTSKALSVHKESIEIVRFRCVFFVNNGTCIQKLAAFHKNICQHYGYLMDLFE